MPSQINIPAILVANVMGIAILFVVAVGNFWRTRETGRENKCLLIMFFSCIMNCIMDPLCFLADGKQGLFNRILVIGCNTLLYLGGVIIAIMWIYLVASRLMTKLHIIHSIVLYVLFGVVVLLLIINLFVPVVFATDENNVYARLGGYWVYNACYVAFMVDGLALYIRRRYTSGGLKFFPVWAFVAPAALGVLIQTVFYGISTATPFTTVSIVCVILCLQNESMLRDKLTGLYNRFYLNTVEKRLIRYPKLKYTAMMLDINGFKKINDTHGHKVGDEALIQLSSILTDAVGKIGEVVRYAGDEFIIIFNTQDDECLESVISRINELLDKFNGEKSAPYNLSIAVGYCKLNFKDDTMDAYMDKIDRLMYENKQKYYQSHTRYDRH